MPIVRERRRDYPRRLFAPACRSIDAAARLVMSGQPERWPRLPSLHQPGRNGPPILCTRVHANRPTLLERRLALFSHLDALEAYGAPVGRITLTTGHGVETFEAVAA